MKRQAKIKVTVVTGFLGAGKTTFINHLLQNQPEKKFALVENEFGDVAIDSSLIKGLDVSNMFELKNGCICCSISNEYGLVLQELAEKFTDVDHLLIETTGVADPVTVIAPFFRDEILRSMYEFTGTFCLVDSLNFMNYRDQVTALKQIAVSDLIVLNKAGSVSESNINRIGEVVRKLNPVASIVKADFGDIGWGDRSWICQGQKFVPAHPGNPEIHDFEAFTLDIPEPPDRDEFLEWLSYTLSVYSSKLFRVKGFILFRGEPFVNLVQGVGGQFTVEEYGLSIGDSVSGIVFIGRGIREISGILQAGINNLHLKN